MKNISSSYSRKTTQYSGQHQKPNPTHDPSEWEESEVVWPSSSWNSPDPIQIHEQPREFNPNPNLSFVISGSNPNMIRKRLGMDPAVSAVSSARAIPNMHVQHSPPSPGYRSGSGPERAQQMSAPISVPVWPGLNLGSVNHGMLYEDSEDENYEIGKNKMVPPHEIVAKSHAKMAFSVFEGAGRTLKGRDMRCVRDAVFRKTGFLD